ncbi:hypothetical protein CFR78_00610 [Komagataeibacter rhaeticus]|uniref:glycosyltransferase n=1 Tax=Komagataeibacter rhaeticus TaxID=215221 RepID=UPI0004D97DFE|nr:glycosyltransferase [Komagataeibacter rhaeticus]KDU96230.1 hypothetical protein GLUCORHAEAF1_03700 [Komagataeibacter rhaeticus AF1]MBL7239054.1 glycosyltransferase [Komagataeibacter rhaeticus]PYD54955.1 hypothetical protein CFR78_00610 [Komagataeibacter rhaeticus]GBQ14017.1 hypothetical protein AA16663_1656 [Komagataeibacter rhaeticus DSM 16663]
MRIVIDLQSCQNGSRHRGIGRYAMSLTKEMITVGKEHEFLIFLTDRFPGSVDYVRKELAGFLPQTSIYVCSLTDSVEAASPDNAWRTRAAEILRTAFISRLEPDMVFIPSPLEGLWDNVVVSIDPAPYPVAVTIHDLIPLEDPKRYIPAQNDQDAYARRISTVKQADLLIAISDFVAGEVRNRIGVEPEKVITALNGIDHRFTLPKPGSTDHTALLGRLGISRPFVLNTSPLEYRKNLEGLIAAFGSMSRQVRSSHQLVIVGKMNADARPYLDKLVRAEGLPADTLVLTGFVSDEDLVALYAACSLFAFPAWSEGFGLPPLEAMACGAPVISANTTSLPEVVGRADMLVDPSSPLVFGQAMERVLGNPAVQQDLRAYGIERAKAFTWTRPARIILSAFEKLHAQSRARQPAQQPILPQRPRVALVCARMDTDSHVAGRLSGLVSALSAGCDVTLYSMTPDDHLDQWTAAQVECRTLEALDWDASQFDQILYAGDCHDAPVLSAPMAAHPGLFMQMRPLESIDDGEAGTAILTPTMQRDIVASQGLAGLVTARQDPGTLAQWKELAGSSLSLYALRTLPEGSAALPLLPLSGDKHAAAHYRSFAQVADDAPLVAVVMSRSITVGSFLAAFRGLGRTLPDARMVIHVTGERAVAPASEKPTLLQGGIHTFTGPLTPHYRGLLSAADLILLGSDLPEELAERCLSDARGLKRPVVEAGDTRTDLSREIADTIGPLGTNGAQRVEPTMLPPSRPIRAWVEAIMAAQNEPIRSTPSQLSHVQAILPGSVRKIRADSDDLGAVAIALAHNGAIERAPRLFIDVTAYAAPGAIRRLDSMARQQLATLFRQGGKDVYAVYGAGEHFMLANQFTGRLAGIRNFYLPDEILSTRPGDRIIGLDFLYATLEPQAAWQQAQAFGATALYFAAGRIAAQSGCDKALADLILQWAREATTEQSLSVVIPASAWEKQVSNIQLTELLSRLSGQGRALGIFSLEGRPADCENREQTGTITPVKASATVDQAVEALDQQVITASDSEVSMQYTVMGHLLGSYSLAIINRAVATTLEQAYPKRTHFLPFETDPISHTEGVPADEKQLMIDLCARPQPDPNREVIISQHWPVMPPPSHPRLALSLFAWEETRVPSDIVQTLTNGFDAIISPAQCVTDALSLSGCRLPIDTIGQPVELDPLRALARQRKPVTRPMRRFLHISSCFPRKGVDVLLAAWARAFTKKDDVELVIKTFPNPHNDVQEQLDALRGQYPAMAPVQIINRDVEPEELLTFYRTADVMVLPTRGEGYNLPALEAMVAGLPLIVTGHGGQRDFCGPHQARLIRFTFARSGSHVAGSHSLWVEPDVDDLTAALREYTDPANIALIEQRRQAALVAGNVENDNTAWVRRFSGMVRDLLQPQDLTAPRVGWVSTWNIKCGIAQYSNYLIDHMSDEQQQNITVFSDHRSEKNSNPIAFTLVWDYVQDTAHDVAAATVEHGVEALVIQHQDGLMAWNELARLGQDPRLSDVVTVVILHNARNLRRADKQTIEQTVQGLNQMSRVLVHNIDDMNYLVSLGVQRNLGLFPHGAFAPKQTPWPRILKRNDAPVIGCHGFFFRHKGIDRLIQAVAKLRRQWPGLKLRLVNARFPDGSHDQVIDHCREVAAKAGLKDAIEWHLDFLPVAEIETLLEGCDVIVLPYDESDDSASGAVRTALATMVPLVATRVKIFSELEGAVAWADNNDPDELAKVIAPLLESPEKRRAIQAGMHDWLMAHDWQHIARNLENMLYGLVRQKRLDWNHPRNRFD